MVEPDGRGDVHRVKPTDDAGDTGDTGAPVGAVYLDLDTGNVWQMGA